MNLPHAATVSRRLLSRLEQTGRSDGDAVRYALELADFLSPFQFSDPDPTEAVVASSEAVELLRMVVSAIVNEGLGSDRVGQSVRNLFECLERGEEGAEQGLVAGEDPRSPQRPT